MSFADYAQDGPTAIITMTDPAKRNMLGKGMMADLGRALGQAREARSRAVILRAEPGAAVWSAGHDVAELPSSRRDPLGWSDDFRVLIRAIEEFPAPVIGLIEGGVWGGACELALTCDILVAVPEATFAITPAKLGVPYNVSGLLTFMNSTGLHVVKEMAFTAQPMPAARAHQLGIVNHLVEGSEIYEFTRQMARGIEKLAPLAIASMKEQLRALASAHSMTPQMFERIQGARRVVYDSADYKEGLEAFKERRRPQFRGE